MSDWGWVALAYGTVYGGLVAYVWSLVLRLRRVRGELPR